MTQERVEISKTNFESFGVSLLTSHTESDDDNTIQDSDPLYDRMAKKYAGQNSAETTAAATDKSLVSRVNMFALIRKYRMLKPKAMLLWQLWML